MFSLPGSCSCSRSGFEVHCSVFGVPSSGFRVQGSGFRVQGSAVRDRPRSPHRGVSELLEPPNAERCTPNVEPRPPNPEPRTTNHEPRTTNHERSNVRTSKLNPEPEHEHGSQNPEAGTALCHQCD